MIIILVLAFVKVESLDINWEQLCTKYLKDNTNTSYIPTNTTNVMFSSPVNTNTSSLVFVNTTSSSMPQPVSTSSQNIIPVITRWKTAPQSASPLQITTSIPSIDSSKSILNSKLINDVFILLATNQSEYNALFTSNFVNFVTQKHVLEDIFRLLFDQYQIIRPAKYAAFKALFALDTFNDDFLRTVNAKTFAASFNVDETYVVDIMKQLIPKFSYDYSQSGILMNPGNFIFSLTTDKQCPIKREAVVYTPTSDTDESIEII